MTNTQPSNAERGDKNFLAAGYMLVSVLLYALAPVFIHAGEAHQAPFMYNAVSTLFEGIGISIYLIVCYRHQLFDRVIWEIVRRNWRRLSLLGVMLSAFGYAIFGWSLKYIDVSVASVLFETWPIWMILLTGKMFHMENRYENINTFGWACLLMGFAGLSFVILSQTSDVVFGRENISSFYLFLGVLLALIAAGMGALRGGCSIRWGETSAKMKRRLAKMNTDDAICRETIVLENASDQAQKKPTKDLAMFFALLVTILASIPSVIIGVALGVWGGHNEIVEVDNMTIAASLGFFIWLPGLIFFRAANLITTKLEINAMAYATPIFTLAWLAMLEYINVPKTDWLIIGATGVVAANALLNFKAERRLAYQSLVVALWICGVAVYFRPIWNAPVFYESMTLVATMFILILSFRIDRLVRRTSEEDEMTMDIIQQISSFPKNMQNKLRDIDEATSPKKLKDAYDAFKRALKKEHSEKAPPEGDKEIAALMRKVNNLAHSKQQGANFGEQAVLWILGGICAGGLLAFMPEDITEKYGIGGFFLETVAFLIAATVIFLLFNIQDLQGDRSRQMIERESDTGESRAFAGIVFREIHDRVAEKWISIIFCAGIVITFGVLFWFKWMPA